MGKDYTNRLGARQVYHYLLLLVILVLLGSLNRPLTTQAGEIPQPVFGNHSILLPLILKWSPGKGIYGQVTVDGAPAAGVGLLLKFFDGFSGYTYANTTTDANGLYSFTGVPSLKSGQNYYVWYENPGDTGRLAYWSTRTLVSYTAGSDVQTGDFDLAEIPLVAPPAKAEVKPPSWFQWTRRSFTALDNYNFVVGV